MPLRPNVIALGPSFLVSMTSPSTDALWRALFISFAVSGSWVWTSHAAVWGGELEVRCTVEAAPSGEQDCIGTDICWLDPIVIEEPGCGD